MKNNNLINQMMKNFKWLTKSFLMISVFFVFSSSCKKENTINPDYVGTWSIVDANSQGEQYKDNITFSKDGFLELGQLYGVSTNKYIDYIKLKGTISVNGSRMSFKVTEIGATSFDYNTGKPTGIIVSYKEGSSQFDNLILQTQQIKSFDLEYNVLGNKLSIMSDHNNDGDYTDANETTVYTRQ